MKPDYILKADILDIIFEKKNKDYGAYPLRKYYHERVYKALGIIFFAAIIFALVGLLSKNSRIIDNIIPPDVFVVDALLPVDQPQAPSQPKPPQKNNAPLVSKPSTADHVPIIVDDIAAPAPVTGDVNDTKVPGTTGDAPPGTGTPGNDGPKSPATTGNDPAPLIDKNNPMNFAEVMPSFPGGIEALREFLRKNLVTPEELEQGQTISVTVQFIVGYDGNLKGFHVVENGGEVFNNEVIRVLKKMKPWIPGKTHGENVSVYYSIPVKFTATD